MSWISVEDALPAEGQEVTAYLDLGQVRQIVRDSMYSGGWRQANCTGWELVSHWPSTVKYWRAEIFERPVGTIYGRGTP